MLNRTAAVAGNTLTEAVRQPVYGIILFSAAALIAFSPSFSMFTMTDDNKIMADMGLATIMLTGLLLAVFTASGVIHKEIERKTVLTVVTKPVNAFEFVTGKLIGIVASLALAVYILLLILILMMRIGAPETASFRLDWPVAAGLAFAMPGSLLIGAAANYFFHRNFASSTITATVPMVTVVFLVLCLFDRNMRLQEFGKDIDWNLARAGVLVSLAIFILGGFATALSTRVGALMNIMLCFAIFIMGLLSDYMFGEISRVNAFARMAYGALPNLQIFWLADALTMDSVIPNRYIGYCMVYAALYLTALVCLAVVGFRTRELS